VGKHAIPARASIIGKLSCISKIDNLYRAEQRLSKIFSVFSFLAILIAGVISFLLTFLTIGRRFGP
jgi:hypothetical protein